MLVEGECVLVEVEDRGMSTEALGVDASEKTTDFRLAGGKKPNSLRGMRPISIGSLSLGRSTHESCFHGGSDSVLDTDGDRVDTVSVSLGLEELQPLGKALARSSGLSLQSPSRRCSSCWASGPATGRPFTPHASTGSTMVFFVCTLSLGHMRLAFRRTAGWQLYLIVRPASVSCGRTWWMYMRASRSSFSPGGADELMPSSELLLFRRPTESVIEWLSARSRSLRFIARTMLSRSPCEPAPTWAVDEAEGPHCFGGALVEVRRCEPSSGFRFLVATDVSVAPASFPSTLVARP
jgi:hypothetical protein